MTDPLIGVPQPAFREKWDSYTKHSVDNSAVDIPETSQTIIESLRTKRKSGTSQWLSALEKQISIPSENGAVGTDHKTSNDPSEQKTMIGEAFKWLDRLFVEFELYATEFNLNAKGTSLIVSCTRPIKMNETASGNSPEAESISYAGHIATQFWALVVRGCAAKVEVFIIPAEFLLGFSVNTLKDTGHEPILVLEPTWQQDDIVWLINGNRITDNQISALAKELFGDLIKVASGHSDETVIATNPSTSDTNTTSKVVSPPNIKSNVDIQAFNPSSEPINIHFLSSIKVAQDLINLIDNDSSQLMEYGKRFLTKDDIVSGEKMRLVVEKLQTLKNDLVIVLNSIDEALKK